MDNTVPNGKRKEFWRNFKVDFEEDEEILNFSIYHRNPTVGQVLIWKAWSLGMTAQYNVLVTNKRVILLPQNNNATFKREVIRYIPFNKIRIIGDSGVLEFEVEERKNLRLTPIRWANKLNKTSPEDLIEIIRAYKHAEQYNSSFIDDRAYSGSIERYQPEPGDTIETRLAGVTFEGRQNILRELHQGQEVRIEREPGNKFDSNAIKVTNYSDDNQVIGYIPKELAAKVSSIIDEYQTELIIGSVSSVYRLKNEPSILGVMVSFDLPDFPEDQDQLEEYEFDKDGLDYKLDEDYFYGDEENKSEFDSESQGASPLSSAPSDNSINESDSVRVIYPKFKQFRRG